MIICLLKCVQTIWIFDNAHLWCPLVLNFWLCTALATSESQISRHIFQGHRGGGRWQASPRHSWKNKTQKKGQGDAGAGVITASVLRGPDRGRLHSQSAAWSVKDTPSLLWKAGGGGDGAVARPRSAAGNDKRERWNNLSGGAAHHREGSRGAKVVCSKTQRLADMAFRWVVSAGSISLNKLSHHTERQSFDCRVN